MEEARNYFIKQIKQNDIISINHKKVCMVLNYTEHLLILDSPVTGCVSIFVFASLVGIPIGIANLISELRKRRKNMLK